MTTNVDISLAELSEATGEMKIVTGLGLTKFCEAVSRSRNSRDRNPIKRTEQAITCPNTHGFYATLVSHSAPAPYNALQGASFELLVSSNLYFYPCELRDGR